MKGDAGVTDISAVKFFLIAFADLHAAVVEADAPVLRRFRTHEQQRLFDRSAYGTFLSRLHSCFCHFICE
jgi:hypothetical protein